MESPGKYSKQGIFKSIHESGVLDSGEDSVSNNFSV